MGKFIESFLYSLTLVGLLIVGIGFVASAIYWVVAPLL